MRSLLVVASLSLLAGLSGCTCRGGQRSDPSGSAMAPAASGAPVVASASGSAAVPGGPEQDGGVVGGIAAEKVAKVVNPDGRAPYSGPTATLRGKVKVTGDPPPERSFEWPMNCPAAAATYGKLFRVGQDDALADVLVAVTGYDGFVPADKPSAELTIQDCAFSARTVALTYGQTIQVRNIDRQLSYLPMLEGSHAPATLVAIPGGDPVKLYAPEPRRYRLSDMMQRPFMVVDVFVLRYATADVTDLSGRYEIARIPVGKVKVSALLAPAKMKAVNQELVLAEGDNELDITIPFDASKDAP